MPDENLSSLPAQVGDPQLHFLREEVRKLEAENARLRGELETTADKLSDVWIHLDAYARGINVPIVEEPFAPGMAAWLLRKQEAPGWKAE